MTTPPHGVPMTPDRWRAVDAILQAALATVPARREEVIASACDGDTGLRAEVDSLLAAHVDDGDDFLEQPVALMPGTGEAPSLTDRLAKALAGRYVIEREVGRGGMASVYVARDLRHGRSVAIKVLREELAVTLGAERFLTEIRVTASLQHPHILPLFDSGNADGLLWYAMPFIEGETLRAYIARAAPLPVAEAVRLAREIADALDHAHSNGIVHRDVKPENVLLDHGRALVADFGIALALEQAGGDRITRTGLALGTPQYMAPEQAAGERALDARVDVYALGAVLHEMLAGEPPFAAPTRQAVVWRMMHELPPVLTLKRPDVTPFVGAVVRRALAKRPEDRFPSVAAFDRALSTASALPLDGALPGPVGANEPHQAQPGRMVSPRAALYAAGAMLVLGLAGGLLIDRSSVMQRWRPAPVSAIRVEPAAPVVMSPLMVFDRTGRPVRGIPANRPWTPRFSPDGRRVAYGALAAGRSSSDLWVTDLDAGTTKQLTDNDGDSNDPQWSADGGSIAFSAAAPGGKDVMLARLDGGATRVLASRAGTQFPSDWRRDGSALLVTDESGERHDVIVQPADGSPPRRYAATEADETAARFSPDGRWVAYTSDESGRPEVYMDSYAKPGQRVKVSTNGGVHPVWRADGREMYYWRDGALVAVQLDLARGNSAPGRVSETVLFRAKYLVGLNTMYDVSPDGQQFVIVQQP